MPAQPPQFDDPALKAALRAQLGLDSASPALRNRIQRLFAEEPAPIALAVRPRSFALHARWTGAAAAILLVAFLLYRSYGPAARLPAGHALFPQPTLVALVEAHKRCCTHPTHRAPDIRQDSPHAMAAALHEGLPGTPVLAADLSDVNWKLRGGAICPVASHRSAHLLFDRNGQTLSIFSLNAEECSSVPDGFYQQKVDDCVVAISAKRGTLHCFLGHCPHGKLEPAEIESLLKRHSQNAYPRRIPQTNSNADPSAYHSLLDQTTLLDSISHRTPVRLAFVIRASDARR